MMKGSPKRGSYEMTHRLMTAPEILRHAVGHEHKKILITDYDESILAGLSYALHKNETDVTACHEFDQAVDALVTTCYDLLIIDIDMPGGSVLKSLELLGFIKRHFCPEVIAMSEYSWRESEAALCRRYGLNYVNKPLNIEEVMAICASINIPIKA